MGGREGRKEEEKIERLVLSRRLRSLYGGESSTDITYNKYEQARSLEIIL